MKSLRALLQACTLVFFFLSFPSANLAQGVEVVGTTSSGATEDQVSSSRVAVQLSSFLHQQGKKTLLPLGTTSSTSTSLVDRRPADTTPRALQDDDAWVQVGADIDGEASGDRFGSSLAMSDDGSRVAIGAHYNNGANGSNSGHVRVFDLDINNAWVQVGADIDGEGSHDWSGYSLAMSDDGSRVAVGAYLNDGANGNDSGHVRVFDLDINNAWVQVGADIDGEDSGDWFGYSLAMSDDGSRVAIGAHLNDGANGSDSGHVRVYAGSSTTPVQSPSPPPTGSPTPSPTASPTPSPTASPTPLPTASPTFSRAIQGSFEIYSTGDVTGTATSGLTIDLMAPYNASNRAHKTTVLSPNCIHNFTGTAADAFTVIDSADVSLGGGFISYESTIAVDISKVNGTEWWEDLPIAGALGGIFDVCLQSAVYFELPDGTTEKMNFVDTNVTVKVEMDANFNITAIDAERKNAIKQDLTLDYSEYVTAYQCAEGSEGSEILGQYSQGDVLKICVKSTDSSIVQVGSIKSLTLSQTGTGAGGAFSYISNGEVADDEIVETACDTSTSSPVHVCHADMQLLGRYFGVDEPGDLTASGSVELVFPTTGRRLTVDVPIAGIRGSSGDVARRMEEETRTPPEAASFNVKVSLEPTDGSGSSFFYGATSTVMSGLVAAAGAATLMV